MLGKLDQTMRISVCTSQVQPTAQNKRAARFPEPLFPTSDLPFELILHRRNRFRLREVEQLLPQANPRAEHPRLYGRYRYAQCLGELSIGPALRLLQNECILQ